MPPEDQPAQPTLPCPTCSGSGREFDRDASGGHYADCRDCHGSGAVRDLATQALAGNRPAPKVA